MSVNTKQWKYVLNLWWAGQDESIVNVDQVAGIIQQDIAIVTIFHLKFYKVLDPSIIKHQ